MKFLLEFLPIVIFFSYYEITADISKATLAAIITTIIQVVFLRVKQGYFAKIPLISLAIITIFGGATIIFKNEYFIKWKPSVLCWIFAISLTYNQLFSKNLWIQKLGDNNISLNNTIWRNINLSWIIFFTFMGIANLYVAYNYATEIWVRYKLFGTLIATISFTTGQAIYIAKTLIISAKIENNN